METAMSNINIIPFNNNCNKTAKTSKQFLENINHTSKIFSCLWEHSRDGIRLTDKQGKIVAVNPLYCQLVGKSEIELIGHHFTCIFADVEDTNTLSKEYEDIFNKRNNVPQNEKRFVLWTNQTIDVEVEDIFIETDNGATLLMERLRDITAEKITHNALAESESKYRGLFANSVMPMFQSNAEGKLINANRAMLKLLGYNNFYELAELNIARDIYAYSEDRTALMDILNQKGYVLNTEIKLKRKNGNIITVLENSRTIVDEHGKIIGYEGVMEDITARKAMEKKLQEYVWALEKSKNALSELNAQKDKLFSILSHDLRSPFSSILGFCDILLKENDQLTSEDRLQFVTYIQEAAQDQLSLVNKLLDWSRLESGRIHMERSNVNLLEIVKKNINSLLGLSYQKQIKLSTTLPNNVNVLGDKQLLNQVFGNLLGNALKFTPYGGSITIELLSSEGANWVIGVKDTGIGIPEEDLHKLFKIEEKYTRKGLQGEKGTGLGLPVVYEIIQKHHGNIEVKSSAGNGTEFIITLPKSIPITSDTILVVDDESGVRALHSRYIKRVLPEINILHATDGKEALELARKYHPRVIISDNDMQETKGPELVQHLKSDPITREIPIVIVTGQDSDANHELLIKYGASEIMNKPISPEQLAEVLEKIDLTQRSLAV